MRRVLPWLSTTAVGLGAAAGAVLGSLGSPGQSPSTWIAQLLATTRAAGTAHVVVTTVVTSRDRALRHTSRTVGSVDLAHRNFALRRTTTPVGAGEVGLGKELYFVLDLLGQPGDRIVNSLPRGGLAGSLGLGNVTTAVTALTPASAAVQVRRLGAGTTGGVATSRYQVVAASRCSSVHTVADEVWVDGHGRLVQAQTSSRQRVPTATPSAPSTAPQAFRRELARGPHAWITVTQTVRFDHFGQAVTIRQPKPTPSVEHLVSGAGTIHLFRHCP